MYLHYVSAWGAGRIVSRRRIAAHQSRFGLSFEDLDSLNQACWSEVWLMTRSRINFIPLVDS
jgi:hypothetical protein